MAERTRGTASSFAAYFDALSQLVGEAESKAASQTGGRDRSLVGKPEHLAPILAGAMGDLAVSLSRLEPPEALKAIHERLTDLVGAIGSHMAVGGGADESIALGAGGARSKWDNAELESLLSQAGDVWKGLEQAAKIRGIRLEGERARDQLRFRLL